MTNRALVIGSQTRGLTGVENDAANVAALLEAKHFAVDLRIRNNATRAGILAGYDSLIAGVRDGDAAVLYYSGHGNFAVSSNGTSSNRLQDIVSFDYDASTELDYRGISSLELSIKLQQLVAKTRNATVILDCCHSAQMSRDGATKDAVPRALPHPMRVDLEVYLASLEKLYPGALRALGTTGNVDAVRMVACAQSEVAMEYTNAKGQRTGAFTEALLELFAEIGDSPISWALLGQAIRQRVLRRFPTQRPDFEGPVDRKVFSLAPLPTADAPAIVSRGAGYRIEAGQIHQVSVGDVFDVAPFTAQTRPIARAVVTATSATTASADVTWLDGTAALPDNAIAILRERVSPRRSVTVIAADDQRAAVAAAIADARTLRAATAVDVDPSIATLRIDGARLTIEDANGPLFPGATYPDSLPDAVQNLANLGAAHALRELQGENGVFATELAIDWGVVEGGNMRALPDQGSALGLGDRLYCRVKNTSKRKLHVHVFNIGLQGTITLVSQWAPSGIALDPGNEEVLGRAFDGTLEGLALSWPDSLPRASFPRIDSLLVLATVNPANLQVLETMPVGMRGIVQAPGSGLEALLAQVQTGATREIKRSAPIDGYFMKQLTYLLHPRDGRMTSPDFLVDDAPGARGTARGAEAWRTSASANRAIAIRLSELWIEKTHAWFATDVRVDALVCTHPTGNERCYRTETLRLTGVKDGDRASIDNVLLYHGPVCDFVDIALWVSRDRSKSKALAELLESRTNESVLTDALTTLAVAGGVATPWVAAAGASAVLIRLAYETVVAASDSAIGLYRTSFLEKEDYGIGRYPRRGLYRAQGFSFSLLIDTVF